MMRMVPRIQEVMVQGAVQPVVNEFRRTDVEPKHVGEALRGVELEIGVPQVGQVVDGRCDVDLQQDVVVPIILPVDLLEGDPVLLYPRVPRQGVDPADADEELGRHVAEGDHRAHVGTPAVAVVVARQGSDGKGSQ